MSLEDDTAFRLFAEAYGKAWAGRDAGASVTPEKATVPRGARRSKRAPSKLGSKAATIMPVR